jgi:hypothetical protein
MNANSLCGGLAVVASLTVWVSSAESAVIIGSSSIAPGSFYVTAQSDFQTSPGTVSGTTSVPGEGVAYSYATLAYSLGAVTGSVNGTTTGGNPPTAGASSEATVYYEVSGPPNTTALVDFFAASTGADAPSASGPDAFADVQAEWSGGQFYACAGSGAALASCSGQGSSFSGTQSYYLSTNTPYDYQTIVTGYSTLGAGSFSAGLDPMIGIDPTWAAENPGYSLLVSPNVGAVPEPEGWAMMLVGFGAIGAAMRVVPRKGFVICGRPRPRKSEYGLI